MSTVAFKAEYLPVKCFVMNSTPCETHRGLWALLFDDYQLVLFASKCAALTMTHVFRLQATVVNVGFILR